MFIMMNTFIIVHVLNTSRGAVVQRNIIVNCHCEMNHSGVHKNNLHVHNDITRDNNKITFSEYKVNLPVPNHDNDIARYNDKMTCSEYKAKCSCAKEIPLPRPASKAHVTLKRSCLSTNCMYEMSLAS